MISGEVNQGLMMTLVAAVAVVVAAAVAVGGHPHHLNAGGPERVE